MKTSKIAEIIKLRKENKDPKNETIYNLEAKVNANRLKNKKK